MLTSKRRSATEVSTHNIMWVLVLNWKLNSYNIIDY